MKGIIPKDQIDRIIEAVDIVNLIGGYVPLKKSGRNYMGLCPFHHEKSPSFVVSETRKNYHCYGCGSHGDPIRFVMEIEHFQFKEAVHFLGDRYGVPIVQFIDNKKEKKESDLGLCLKAAQDYFRTRYTRASKDSGIAGYMKERDFCEKTTDHYQLGYVSEGWTLLHDHLTKKGFDNEIQEKAGLIKKKEKGGYYDRLRNRVIFPIFSDKGRLLGFAGRIIGKGKPKYLNPPETPLYKKSSTLYGVHEALNAIRKNQRVILVEGYFDVLRLHQEGWGEALAACGTALGEGHIQFIKGLNVPNVYLLFDGDKAGQEAAERSGRLFLEMEVDCRIAVLPQGVDPDDFFKENETIKFETLLDQSIPDYEYVIQKTKKQSLGKGIEFQKNLLQELLDLSGLLKNRMKRDLFLTRISETFGIEKKNLSTPEKKRGKAFGHGTEEAIPSGFETGFFSSKHFKGHELEVRFIQYLIFQAKSIVKARQYIVPDDFSHLELAELYQRFIQLSEQEFASLNPMDFADFFVEQASVIMWLIQTGKDSFIDTFSEKVLDELIYPLKLDKINQAIKTGKYEPNAARDLAVKKRELREKYKHLIHRNEPFETKS